jgi:hypothetical protein
MVSISAKFDNTNNDKDDSGFPDNTEAKTAVAVKVSALGDFSFTRPTKPSLIMSFAIKRTKPVLKYDKLVNAVGARRFTASNAPKPNKEIKAFLL